MRTRIAALFVAALALLAIAASPAGATPRVLRVPLAGSQVPTGGDPRGSGTVTVVVDDISNRVCVALVVRGFLPVSAHIHKAAAGQVGPPAVAIDTPRGTLDTSASVTCTPTSAEVVRDMIATPALYYVNVHSNAYPQGAVRGQLA